MRRLVDTVPTFISWVRYAWVPRVRCFQGSRVPDAGILRAEVLKAPDSDSLTSGCRGPVFGLRQVGWLVIVSGWCLASSVVFAQPLSDDDRTWLHIYVRDRRLATALDNVGQFLQQGRAAEAAAQLQAIFEQPGDAWLMTPAGELKSVREQSLELLTSQSPVFIRDYQRLIDPDAIQELARARASDQPADYLRVVRQFFPTESGYFAAEWLVKHWLDEGSWQLAADLSRQFTGSPLHQPRLSPRFLKMAIVANELAGRQDEGAALRQRLSQTAGLPLPREVAGAALWLQPLGRAQETRNRPGVVSPPILEPLWSRPLESLQTQLHVTASLTEWAAAQREREEPTAVGWVPVRSGNRAVFRELDLIRAVDLRTGETVWRYRTGTSLASLLNNSDLEGNLRRHRPTMWEAAAANSLVSGLSTDGQRIYAVESTDLLTKAGIFGLESYQLPQVSRRDAVRNELIALDLWSRDDRPRLLWRTGSAQDLEALRGHAFLGPPLAVGSVLYAISENDRELCVSALDAATGRLLWQQPIAEAEHALIEDRGRSTRAFQPAISGDLVICPTGIGLLVAVDAVSGTLRWVHNSLDIPAEAGIQRFRTLTPLTQRHHAAFPARVHTTDSSIVYLPSQSSTLYCLDPATGSERWHVEDNDAEYIALVDPDQVLVIGKSIVRAYGLADGKQQWFHALDDVISGIGCPAGAGYLVPLASGRIVNVNRQTGRSTGFRFESQLQPVGHLLASDTAIVSVGAHGITAFPQAAPVLAELKADPQTPQTAIKIAEVELVQGNLTSAITGLQQAWKLLPAGEQRQQAQHLLRESYFQLLADDAEQADRWLAELEVLLDSASPGEKVRWLIAATERALIKGDWSTLQAQYQQLAEQPDAGTLVECPGDRDLQISSSVWLQLLADRLNDPSRAAELEQTLLSAALADPGSTAGRTAERVLPAAVTAPLRLQQATAAIASGEWQRAVLLLKRAAAVPAEREPAESAVAASPAGESPAAESPLHADVVADSGQSLARLLATAGFPTEAAQVLAQQQPSGLNHEPLRPRALFGQDMAGLQAAEAWQRRQPVTWPVRQVAITSRPRQFELATDFLTAEVGNRRQPAPYEDYQRTVGCIPPESSLEWMLRNSTRGTEIGVFDKTSSRKLMEVVLPFGASPPGTLASLPDSLLVPFSLPGEIRALSPLQGDRDYVAWSLVLPEWSRRSGQALCGPSTSTRTCFQWRNVLLMVDPADGRLLWRRNDIEPNSGIYADSRIGLLADDEIVFVLAADKTHYRVLNARTGSEIRKGVLTQDVRFARYALGSLILHLSDDVEQRHIRVWDPATDQLVLNDTLRSRQLFTRFSDEAVAWMTSDARLKVFSARRGRIIADVPLTRADLNGAATLRVSAQQGWHFISINRNQPLASTTHFHVQLQDKLIPGDTFRDDLLAIGPEGDRIRWRRTIPLRNLLQLDADVPFLIAGCLVRDKRDQNRRWLRIEAIDRESGVLLGMGDLLPNDKLLHGDYDGRTGHVRLLGRSTIIDLDFSQPVQRQPLLDDGLVFRSP